MNKKDRVIKDLLESYMECGYDKVTIYLTDGSYHTFELYNTHHKYRVQDGLLRITKYPTKLSWGEQTPKQEITFFVNHIEKIIVKE